MELQGIFGALGSARTSDLEAGTPEQVGEDKRELVDQINQLKSRILELEHAADTDPLVPVYNRRAFIREIERAQTLASRYSIECSIIFFDLNGFKAVNDRFGHSIGDEMLTKVGKALKAAVRECDMVARIGGDEFGVLLFKTDEECAKSKAASLACHIAGEKIAMPTGDISLSAAWGVARCDQNVTAKQVVARADRAMYACKNEISENA